MSIPKSGLEGASIPGRKVELLTRSDTQNVPHDETRGIILDVAGAVSLMLADDDTAKVHSTLTPGIVHPLAVKRFMLTGSDDIVVYGVY